jgi:hypothetical protein
MQQAITDRVGDGGLSDDVMPLFGRTLAGDHGGIFVMSVLDDFEQVFALGVAERGEKQIVEDEQFDLGQFGK